MGEVTDYVGTLEEPARSLVGKLIAHAGELVPEHEEGMSYGMPALRYRGRPLVSIVVTRRGYSLFPFSSTVVATVTEGQDIETTKGGIRFTDARPVPVAVVEKAVLARKAEIDASY
ncbi:hypothetical protein BAY61_22355 [Prauserella marina]|uniref:Uncharacterized conserved protein YdhG, YjbR/CyaY-like superfamily, DUF1801 family n=1 Tax=Prauserella marina TaxID=530584 RepID=A0A222VTP3_9PSEU|nr:hypothetical protein [Prauserella marina]ASR37284.1 hypothetical protein BAY61_22355 [Prauserella marina]PWV72621.1 uncharacterized protein YdhG (YjbR/CyaY superfamily) [Prauserella marina]SDD75821.1 Uncharacterized conserved protein YdhG, YjbR/CyaY-like superfamily, DUF1801 family [Prauserella marina]